MAHYQATTLAKLNEVGPAREAFAAAAPTLTPKPLAVAQADQAHMLARAGHVDEACALAVEALTVSRQYGFERVAQRIRALRAELPNSRETAALDDLDHG